METPWHCLEQELLLNRKVLEQHDHGDVRLVCSNGSVAAHRVILASVIGGPFCKALEQDDSTDQVQLLLPDFDKITVHHFISLLYTGKSLSFCKGQDLDVLQNLKDLNHALKGQPLSLELLDSVVEDKEPKVVKSKAKKLTKARRSYASKKKKLTSASKEEKQKKEQESTFLVFNEDSSTLDEVTFLRTPKRLISVPETISEEVEDSNWRSNFVHDDIKSCYVCDFQCDGLHALTRHLKSHEDPICCKICGTKSSSGRDLHNHMRSHFNGLVQDDGTVVVRCHICGARLSSRSKLKAHKAEAHPNVGLDSYQCHVADCEAFSCSNLKEYTSHLLQRHGLKPFQCNKCDASYLNKKGLKDHEKAKHSSVRVSCDICAKNYSTRSLMLQHRQEQHKADPERLTKCQVCGFQAKGRKNLNRHKKIHLNQAQKFQCTFCSKLFRNKFSVVVHERVHTGEAPYQCDLCQINFKRSHHLQSHLKTAAHQNKTSQPSTQVKTQADDMLHSKDMH